MSIIKSLRRRRKIQLGVKAHGYTMVEFESHRDPLWIEVRWHWSSRKSSDSFDLKLCELWSNL